MWLPLPGLLGLALLLVVGLGSGAANGLRVLAIFPLPVHSHFMMFKGLADALEERGHEVVMVSGFPAKRPRANHTDIDASLGRPPATNTYTFEMLGPPHGPPTSWTARLPGGTLYQTLAIIEERAGNALCRDVFALPEFRRLLDGGYGRFDVVLTEIFGSDCFAAVAHHLGLPNVGVSSAPDVSWMHERIGSVDNPAYIVNVFTDFIGRMTLWERLQNAMSRVFLNFLHTRWMVDGSDAVVREFLGEGVPPLRELVRNTSLVLLNRHVSIHAARPLTPNQVHVGGLHIKAPDGSLDPELRRWMDEAEHGVIFFSLGSLIRADSMPAAMRDALLAAFARLPQRVLWKFESDAAQLPANVRVAKWLPQMDVLSHPKTILFITHGGLMGTLEALHVGVPMLGIPLFADQMSNVELYKSIGIAERLEVIGMTADSVHASITPLTTSKRYRERARAVSALFRDRPRQAADEAVWWIEYVARHRGAPHLRPLGADMPLHQYLLLDVVALVAAAALVAVLAAALVLRLLLRTLLCSSSSSHRDRSKVKRS